MRAAVRGRARGLGRQRGAGGDAAGRRWLHVHRRTTGASSTRSTCATARPGASSGRWTPASRSSIAIAASRSGTISSSRSLSIDSRVIATDKETGKVVWDKNLRDSPDMFITAAPLALKDRIIVGASGGDRGVRNWIAALDPKTGDLLWKTHSIPAPGEPGSETWKDKNNAWETGGGAFYVTGTYDPAVQPDLLGLRQSGAGLRRAAPARRQSLHVERDRIRCGDRQDLVVAPVHAERQSRLRRDRHPHPHRRQGERRGSQDRLARRPQRLQLHASTAPTASSSRPCST